MGWRKWVPNFLPDFIPGADENHPDEWNVPPPSQFNLPQTGGPGGGGGMGGGFSFGGDSPYQAGPQSFPEPRGGINHPVGWGGANDPYGSRGPYPWEQPATMNPRPGGYGAPGSCNPDVTGYYGPRAQGMSGWEKAYLGTMVAGTAFDIFSSWRSGQREQGRYDQDSERFGWDQEAWERSKARDDARISGAESLGPYLKSYLEFDPFESGPRTGPNRKR